MDISAKNMTVAPDTSCRGQSLWFRTAAGPEIGYGHLRRCFTLARQLEHFCTPLFLLDSGDLWVCEQVSKTNWKYYSCGVEKAWERMPDPAAILIDTRVTAGLDEFIAKARNWGVPVISIHDLGLAPIASDIAIDGSVIPAASQMFSTELYSGTEYMVLDPGYGILNRTPKLIREQTRSVCVNLGGGNSGRYFPAIMEGLKQWGRELDVIGIPGFVQWGQIGFGLRDWRPLQFHWENGSVETGLSQADLAFTAGGLSLYESLCAGVPVAALSYDSLQQRTISALTEKGACLDLGPGNEVDPAKVLGVVSSLTRAEKRRNLSSTGKKLVDGRGAERVAEIIRRAIGRNLGKNCGGANGSSTRV